LKDYHRLSIAPMMSYTDRHFRFLMRQFTRRSLLYTEMVVSSTITRNLKSDYLDRVLGFDPIEHPIAVQLGGDDPAGLAVAARVCQDYGYDEVNLNVGCPSDRVQKGRFGACLMKEPEHVARITAAMQAAVSIPVTVKHRIGVDDQDDYEQLAHFVETVSKAGPSIFIGHARKAWLKGLSPAQNRTIPPLLYERIYELKKDFPDLTIVVNGGIESLESVLAHLDHVDGAMIGREAFRQPRLFEEADARVFGEEARGPVDMAALVEKMNDYIHQQIEQGSKLSFSAKHLVGLFKNQPRARLWRQRITELIQQNPKAFDLHQIYRETVALSCTSA